MEQVDRRGAELARVAAGADVSIAVAESLTGGALASRLARLPEASTWFRGSVVAYASSVKHELLGVPDVHVVSEPSARAMAEGVSSLLRAEVAISVTGEGGPEPQDDVPVGTVWMAITDGGRTTARHLRLDGGPAAVVQGTCDAAVDWLTEHLLSRAPAR
jgi:nicotinamide-nucleotide amidase